MKRLSVLGAVIAWSLSTVTVLATPGSGATSSFLAWQTFDAISTSQAAGRESVIQEITIAPGGHTGWHTHPGATLIFVESGNFSFYNDSCVKADTPAGRGAFEVGGQVQLARNEGSVPFVVTIVYLDIASPDGPVRADAAAPACAAGAGLPTTATGSGVTAAFVDRATFASAATFTNGDERDVVVQQISFAPGGHSGWHSHPGATQIFVVSGTQSFYGPDCVRQNFTAGQGVVEPGGGVQLARNESTTETLNLFVVFYDVPRDVAGGFRIDQPEPSTCTGLAPVATTAPAASALPNTASDAVTGGSIGTGLLALTVLLAIGSGGLLVWRHRRS